MLPAIILVVLAIVGTGIWAVPYVLNSSLFADKAAQAAEYAQKGDAYAEEGKWRDYTRSVPGFVFENVIKSALQQGKIPVILAEEWHTAAATVALHKLLVSADLRKNVVMFWNANNTMSFERLDWWQLSSAAQLTTVSRYMKHLMWQIQTLLPYLHAPTTMHRYKHVVVRQYCPSRQTGDRYSMVIHLR